MLGKFRVLLSLIVMLLQEEVDRDECWGRTWRTNSSDNPGMVWT